VSTIIILTPPVRPQRVAKTDTGAEIRDEQDATIATFNSVEDAQAYLRSIEQLQGAPDAE
jgi:hypothetical protein